MASDLADQFGKLFSRLDASNAGEPWHSPCYQVRPHGSSFAGAFWGIKTVPWLGPTCTRVIAYQSADGQPLKWWELRATVSLVRLLIRQNLRNEPRAMLAEIYNWFNEDVRPVWLSLLAQ